MSLENDIVTLEAFLSEFDPYLKSDVVFWNVGKANAPALTLGGILFLRRTLSARRTQLDPKQSKNFDRLDLLVNDLLNRWMANVEKKTLSEISSRLNVWDAAFDDLADHYPQAVYSRVYLALLMPLVARLAEAERFRQRLSGLDSRLRGMFTTGNFIWDAAIAPAFPRELFWYLYGKPAQRE
ncbi:MAG: hypothetical protein HZB17_00170 [Chloroflexi bacterium]|nr:hypothetical protein [Chloroflexota bacterium]